MRKISKLKKYIRENFDIAWEYSSQFDIKYKIAITKKSRLYFTYGSLQELCKLPFMKYMHKRGITEFYCSGNICEEPFASIKGDNYCGVANYGFSPKENKWYGWSHRAIYGFTIGSEVKKSHCAYHAPNREDFIEDMIRFYGPLPDETDQYYVTSNSIDDEKFEIVTHYVNVPNKSLNGTTRTTIIDFPKKYGRGEWKAETMDDARQMAIDFAEGVS